MKYRLAAIAFILASLVMSIAEPVFSEEILPDLPIISCEGGPAPQVAGQIVEIDASNDGSIIVYTRFPQEICRFSPGTMKPIKVFQAEVSLPLVTIVEESTYVASLEVTEEDGFFKLAKFSLEDGSKIAESEHLSGELFQLLYSPAEKCVISASNTGEIRKWAPDLKSSVLFKKVAGIYSVVLDASGKRLIIYTPNKLTEIYSLATGAMLGEDTTNSYSKILMIGDTNKAVANTYGRGVMLINIETGEEIFEFEGGVNIKDIALSEDMNNLLISHVDGTLLNFDLSPDTPVLVKKEMTGYRGGTMLSINARFVTIWTGYSFDCYSIPKFERMFSSEEPKLFQFFGLSPSSQYFCGFYDDKIFNYTLQGNVFTPLGSTLILESDLIDLRGLRFSNDSSVFLVGAAKTAMMSTADYSIKPLYSFPQTILMPSPRFCCGDKYLLVMGKDSEIVVYETMTGKVLVSFLPTTYVEEAIVSDDLALVAMRAVPAEIYRLEDRKRVFSLRKGLFDITFSKDGKSLIGYNNDGVVSVSIDKFEVDSKIHVPGTIDKLIVGDKRAIAFTNQGVYLVDLVGQKLLSGREFLNFEVSSADYCSGVCVFQDSDSRIFRLDVNLD